MPPPSAWVHPNENTEGSEVLGAHKIIGRRPPAYGAGSQNPFKGRTVPHQYGAFDALVAADPFRICRRLPRGTEPCDDPVHGQTPHPGPGPLPVAVQASRARGSEDVHLHLLVAAAPNRGGRTHCVGGLLVGGSEPENLHQPAEDGPVGHAGPVPRGGPSVTGGILAWLWSPTGPMSHGGTAGTRAPGGHGDPEHTRGCSAPRPSQSTAPPRPPTEPLKWGLIDPRRGTPWIPSRTRPRRRRRRHH